MIDVDSLLRLGTLLIIVGPVAALFAALLRQAGIPGGAPSAAALGGAIAGTLLGASALGRAAPDAYERFIAGGGPAREALRTAQREHTTELLALREAGASEQRIEELAQRHEARELELELALRHARREARRPALLLGTACLFALLATSSLRQVGTGKRPENPEQMRHDPPLGALTAALGTLLIAGLPMALLAHWTLEATRSEALAFGLIGTISGFAPTLAARRVGAAGRTARIEQAGFAGALLTSLIALGVAPRIEIALLPPALFASVALGVRIGRASDARRAARWLIDAALLPALTAITLLTIDIVALSDSGGFWVATLIAVIFSSDGRWLGGWLGWWIAGSTRGRAEAWRRSAATLNSGAGGVQIGLALLLHGAGVLTDAMLAAGVIGAIVVELSVGVRVAFARMLDEGRFV